MRDLNLQEIRKRSKMLIKSLLPSFLHTRKENDVTEIGASGKFHGFYKSLVTSINNPNNKYKPLTKYCPPFFKLLCNILNDKLTGWNTKLMIDAALAYLVLPDDIIPDHEDSGYIDDLFIICYVLKEIKDKVSPQLITDNWNEEEDILALIDHIYDESNKVVSQSSVEILRKVGLHKYQSLNLGEYSGTYHQRLAKLGNEKRELLGLLSYLIKQLFKTNIRGLKTEDIKELLKQYGDYDEICRLIELSKMNHEYLSTIKTPLEQKKRSSIPYAEIEAKLKAARIKALVSEETEKQE